MVALHSSALQMAPLQTRGHFFLKEEGGSVWYDRRIIKNAVHMLRVAVMSCNSPESIGMAMSCRHSMLFLAWADACIPSPGWPVNIDPGPIAERQLYSGS